MLFNFKLSKYITATTKILQIIINQRTYVYRADHKYTQESSAGLFYQISKEEV